MFRKEDRQDLQNIPAMLSIIRESLAQRNRHLENLSERLDLITNSQAAIVQQNDRIEEKLRQVESWNMQLFQLLTMLAESQGKLLSAINDVDGKLAGGFDAVALELAAIHGRQPENWFTMVDLRITQIYGSLRQSVLELDRKLEQSRKCDRELSKWIAERAKPRPKGARKR